jgi:hypothetical protein
MKKHFLSITLLLAPAAMFAMDTDGEPGIVQQLVDAAPKRVKKAKAIAQVVQQDEEQAVEEDEWEEAPVQQLAKAGRKQQAAQAAEVQEANGVAGEEVATVAHASAVTAASQAIAPTEELKDIAEAAYERGFLGSLGMKAFGHTKTTYVQKYLRCNERCAQQCDHPITIQGTMTTQLTNDRRKAIMSEQTNAIKGLQANSNGSIPNQHDVQTSIHQGPIQALGALIRGSKQSVNFKLKDADVVKRADVLLRNQDVADLQYLADVYEQVQARMADRKKIRADLNVQKPAESDIVYSDTEYGDDKQFVEKLQSYRIAKKAAEKAAKK